MDETTAVLGANVIYQKIFPGTNTISIEDINKFTTEIRLPFTRGDVFGSQVFTRLSQSPMLTLSKLDEYTVEHSLTTQDSSQLDLDALVSEWNKLRYRVAERTPQSTGTGASDMIYESQNVYASYDVASSTDIYFSDQIMHSKSLLACANVSACERGFSLTESRECLDSAYVWWSVGSVRSYCIVDCFNVTDCMLCAHITEKKYCIANIQYTEDEYNQLKPILLELIAQGKIQW